MRKLFLLLLIIVLILICKTMKANEKLLIDMLETHTPSSIEKKFERERLKKIPTQKAKISVNIKQTFYRRSVMGNLQQITDPDTQLPPEFQTNFAIPIWGTFDYNSRYSLFTKLNTLPKEDSPDILSALPEVDRKLCLRTINIYDGYDYDFQFLEGATGNIQGKPEIGDLYIIYSYQDLPGSFNFNYDYYLGIIVISTTELSYGSLLSNIQSTPFNIETILFNYTAINDVEFQEKIPINRYIQKPFGKTTNDSMSVGAFKTVNQQQNNIIALPYNEVINQYVFWYYFINYKTITISFEIDLTYINRSKPIIFDVTEHICDNDFLGYQEKDFEES